MGPLAEGLDEILYRHLSVNPVMVQEIMGMEDIAPYLSGLSPMVWVAKGINGADQVQGVKDFGCVHFVPFVVPFVVPFL